MVVGSKQEAVKYFQKNYKTTEDPPPRYRHGPWRLDVCIYIFSKFNNFPISFWPQSDRRRCLCTRCLHAWHFPHWKSTEILYQITRFCTKIYRKNTDFFRPLPGAMQINTYLISKGPNTKPPPPQIGAMSVPKHEVSLGQLWCGYSAEWVLRV